MKIQFLTLLATLLLSSCSKDNPKDPIFALPPETQTGANTFGVTINGKVYVPRDPTGGNGVFPSSKGMTLLLAPDNVSWVEINVKDGASAVGFNIYLHMQEFITLGARKYTLHQSNFRDGVDSIRSNHIYFIIWDNNIRNYAYYGSLENQGEINITRNSNGIVSGNFKGKFVRYDNPNEFITINDGRFDIGPGLYDKVFP